MGRVAGECIGVGQDCLTGKSEHWEAPVVMEGEARRVSLTETGWQIGGGGIFRLGKGTSSVETTGS